MSTTLDEIFENVNSALKKVNDNDLLKTSREKIESYMKDFALTDDARAQMMIDFEVRLALGMYEKALMISADNQIREQQVATAKLDKQIKLAELKDKYGYTNATEDALGESNGVGLVDKQKLLLDKQIEGFLFDQMYKLNKNTSEMISMLAMNGVATPQWMANIFRITAEAMSRGKVNITVTKNPAWVDGQDNGDTPEYITTVAWDGAKEQPDGI